MIERLDIYLYTYCEINKGELIGARMSLFEIETTILKNSYTDPNKHIAQMNPVIADSNGRFPKIFIEKPYKVVIQDKNGEHIFEDSYE